MNTLFSNKEALKFGWLKTKSNLSFFALLSFTIFCVSLLFSEAGANSTNFLAISIFNIAQIVFGVLLGMGYIYVTLLVVRGESFDIKDIIKPAPQFWKYFGASLLYMLIVMVGLVLLIVPGVILMIRLGFYKYLIVDKKDISITQALRESMILTKGITWKLFLFTIVLGLINLLGFLCFVAGLLVTIPLSAIAFAYVYNKLIRRLEPVVEEKSTPSIAQSEVQN